MKKTLIISCFLIAILGLTGCNLSAGDSKSSDTEMQTEIVMLLTSMVTETQTPEVVATSTQLPVEPTKEATMIPVVLVTPTIEATQQVVVEIPTLDITPSDQTYELLTFTPTDEVDDSDSEDTSTEEVDETESPSTDDPELGLGDPTYQDTFENGDNWSLGRDSYMDLRASNGNLVMRGLSPISGWRITNKSLANGYIQLTGKMVDCSGIDNYGIYFRVPNARTANSGYLFGISCDGKYSLRKWDGEDMTSLIYWKSSDSINKGSNKTNKLGVMLDGYQIKLYVNGDLVGVSTDDDYGIGSVGIFIGAKETADLTVLINDLSIWKK